jgi:hypothetical protein
MEEGLFDPSPSAETREFLSKPLLAGHGLFPILLLALISYSGLPSIPGRSIRHRTVRQRRDSIQTLDKYALAFKVRETWERGGLRRRSNLSEKRVSVVPLNHISIKNISWIACLS